MFIGFINLQSAKKLVGTLMLLYHLTRVSKIVDLKVKVSFSMAASIPSPFPPFNVGSISLVTEDITPPNIVGPGGTFDRLQPKVC